MFKILKGIFSPHKFFFQTAWGEKTQKLSFLFVLFLFLLFTFKYLWLVATPFVIGFFLASLLDPLVRKGKAFAHWPRKIVARLVFFSFILMLGLSFFYIAFRLFREITQLLLWLQKNQALLQNWFNKIATGMQNYQWLQFLQPQDFLHSSLRFFMENLRKMITAMPQFFLIISLSMLTTYFLLNDKEKLLSNILNFWPDWLREKTIVFKREVYSAVSSFIRIQITLALVSFCYTWFVFNVFSIPNSFLWGVAAGIFDLLPLIGPTLVFIPWSVWFILQKDWGLGSIIFTALVVLLILRQIMEPKLVGASIGYHPLFALMALYIGIKFYGISGIIFGPLILIVVRAVYISMKVNNEQISMNKYQ